LFSRIFNFPQKLDSITLTVHFCCAQQFEDKSNHVFDTALQLCRTSGIYALTKQHEKLIFMESYELNLGFIESRCASTLV